MYSRSRAAFATLAPIESAIERAHFTQAEQLLREIPDQNLPEVLLLTGTLQLFRDDAPAAILVLSNKHFGESHAEMERSLLLAVACTRVGEYDAADEYFDAAHALAERFGETEALAEIAYRRGRRYGCVRDVEKAREQLQRASLGRSQERKFDALQLESFIYGLEGRYALQAGVLQGLLDQIDPDGERFTLSAAYATHTLAVLGRELDLPHALPAVERQLRVCKWPPDLNVQRFQSLKALGWSYALRGDYFNAFRYLKKSLACAPSSAWCAIATTDRAYLARCLNEDRWSRQELSEAEEVADTIDWRSTRNEERVGLLLLAEMFAPIDPGKAA